MVKNCTGKFIYFGFNLNGNKFLSLSLIFPDFIFKNDEITIKNLRNTRLLN